MNIILTIYLIGVVACTILIGWQFVRDGFKVYNLDILSILLEIGFWPIIVLVLVSAVIASKWTRT
jgi:hypothetical protein